MRDGDEERRRPHRRRAINPKYAAGNADVDRRDDGRRLEASKSARQVTKVLRKPLSGVKRRMLRAKRASANATRWRVGLRARAAPGAAKAVTVRMLRDAREVRARWLDGARVTICADSRSSRGRLRPSASQLDRLTSLVSTMRAEFDAWHPDIGFHGEDEPTATEAEPPAPAPAPPKDPFVLWMLEAQELAPDVFARDLHFVREFATDGAPFTRAMRMIDGWVETNVRRLEDGYGDRVDASWLTGVPFVDTDAKDADTEVNEQRCIDAGDVVHVYGETATATACEGMDIDSVPLAAPAPELPSTPRPPPSRELAVSTQFALTPFPMLPLELLPVQHFVLGLWSKPAETAPAAAADSAPPESFALPWLDKAWVDILHGSGSAPRKKRARVWRGKNLDMIVYGEDEKQTWASKIAAFLKRARSALGNRALDRDAWGGSILDSLIGANLTQNVSDVLSSTAFMNLAARFPYDESVDEENRGRLFVRALVSDMFAKLTPPPEPETRDVEMPAANDDDDKHAEDNVAQLHPFDSPPRKAKLNAPKTWKKPKPNAKNKEASRPLKDVIADVLARPDPTRTEHTRDQVNWYAVADAPLVEIVKCIRCRGMHWMLARRIKGILKRILAQRGVLSLEFLRNTPTKDASEYLLALDGMGVKTTSCVLLLALHRTDFPVDVNVGRIMARLGWVPLESETALEELAQYAPEPAVYTFLRERLNSFGVELLYELHYHMITLGKVFCGKRMPNCGACPLRDICEYAKQGGKCVDRPDGHSGLSSLQPEAPIRQRQSNDIEDLVPEQPRVGSNVHKNLEKSNNSSAVLGAIIAAGKAWDKKGRPNGAAATSVLLLSSMTTRDDIMLAYVRLSRVVHPDKNSHPDATTAFQYITAARKVALNISTEDEYQQTIEAELEEMIRLAAEEPEEVMEEELTGMELSETVIRASKMRVETVGWAVTTDMLPDELIAALGGVDNSQGCIMAPIDSNLKPLNEVTNEFIECAVFVSCRSAMHAKFPLHGTYFQVNVRFSRLALDVLETDPSCVFHRHLRKSFWTKHHRMRRFMCTRANWQSANAFASSSARRLRASLAAWVERKSRARSQANVYVCVHGIAKLVIHVRCPDGCVHSSRNKWSDRSSPSRCD